MIEVDWSKAPEGATHYLPTNEEKCWDACWYRMDAKGGWRGWNASAYLDGAGSWVVDKSETEVFPLYLIDRPKAWTGAGLPPVGTVCDDDAGNQVVIVAHHINGAHAIFAESHVSGLLYYGKAGDFRPIRTPEQIAADARNHAIRNACTAINQRIEKVNINIDCSSAIAATVEAMIDAGYRKIPDELAERTGQ